MANQAYYPLATMCRLLGVSTSGYYAWRQRSAVAANTSRYRLDPAHPGDPCRSDRTYGGPRIHAELAARGGASGSQAGRLV